MVIGILIGGILLGSLAQAMFFDPTNVQIREAPEQGGWKSLEKLAQAGEWGEVWWNLPKQLYRGYGNLGPLGLAILAGVCWFAFLLHSLRCYAIKDWRLWTLMAGIALGVLSIWLTGFFILWQEVRWNLQESMELVSGIRYCVLGIGLREELAKLICLLPLMPILVRKGDALATLLISASVGLGFAMEENVDYFTGENSSTLGRFLTANPFHMAMTGLIGLYLYRAIRSPQAWGPHALAAFGLTVVAHGLYDAMLMIPVLQEYSLFATIVFALVIYQFFHEMRELRSPGSDVISLSATFLFGVSLLTAVTFVYLCGTVGFDMALDALVSNVLGLAVMVYLFLREMPESMVQV